ncbi:TnsA-like heteromeric transposase endonuclease subunit [Amycolatopsis sp. cg13]|uniref:TnsA-like heteromeric transposase endonuclease subunit n=1 Tax=Amycolatopsis sp. cg13 TaxID=3238807 RepID=UPI0035249236
MQFLVSTARHHGYESLAEARLLLTLDFAGCLLDVLSQPVRLRFDTADGPREHIPDFFAVTERGRWLIDVRPAGRIGERDAVAFAATDLVAARCGWGYAVTTSWRHPGAATVDALAAQRRPLDDRLGMIAKLLDAAAHGPRPFAALAAGTSAPAIARTYLLHLLWHRPLTMDLHGALSDSTAIGPVRTASGRVR